MCIIDEIRDKGEFLGVIVATDDYTSMEFHSPHPDIEGISMRSYFRDYGDLVYFMFVNDHLMKIGKAAGDGGWNVRVNQYKRGLKGDQTNKLILSKLKNNGSYVIEVLGLKTPRIKTQIPCPLTETMIDTEIETAGSIEKYYTKKFLKESNENKLAFCRQIN